MATTFVAIKECGFWISDSILELWLRLLALHIEEPVEPITLNSKIREQWLLASRGYFTGCIPDGLEEITSTQEGTEIVRRATKSLLHALQAAPSSLSKDVFNILGFEGGHFTADIETRILIEVAHAFLDLIDGKITTGASSTSSVPGSR